MEAPKRAGKNQKRDPTRKNRGWESSRPRRGSQAGQSSLGGEESRRLPRAKPLLARCDSTAHLFPIRGGSNSRVPPKYAILVERENGTLIRGPGGRRSCMSSQPSENKQLLKHPTDRSVKRHYPSGARPCSSLKALVFVSGHAFRRSESHWINHPALAAAE
jgi:hypothetical protein